MKNGLIFANARAKALEGNLFTEDRLYRMMECGELSDAVKILFEAGYAGGMVIDNPADYDALLQEEQRIVTDFVRGVIPEGSGLECFFVKNDYHNLKSLIKAKYAELSDVEQMILPDGNVAFSELKEKFDAGKLESSYMSEAVNVVAKKFDAGEGTPRFIDVTCDKAMYADIVERAKTADKLIKDYFTALIDATNISSLFRCHNVGGNVSFFENTFIEGGEVSLKTLTECFSEPYAKTATALRGTKYADLVAKVESSDLSAYETAQDNFLLKLFSSKKSDMFSVAPIIGYYLAKLNELLVIRVVLVCIKNKVDKTTMKRRVRTLYE